MKLSLAIVALALAIPSATYAQDSTADSSGKYPNTFSSGSANVTPFTNQSKRFNDWSISVGAGVPLLQSGIEAHECGADTGAAVTALPLAWPRASVRGGT